MPPPKTEVEQALVDFIDIFDEVFFEDGPLTRKNVLDARRAYVTLRTVVSNEAQEKLLQYLKEHPEEMKLLVVS